MMETMPSSGCAAHCGGKDRLCAITAVCLCALPPRRVSVSVPSPRRVSVPSRRVICVLCLLGLCFSGLDEGNPHDFTGLHEATTMRETLMDLIIPATNMLDPVHYMYTCIYIYI